MAHSAKACSMSACAIALPLFNDASVIRIRYKERVYFFCLVINYFILHDSTTEIMIFSVTISTEQDTFFFFFSSLCPRQLFNIFRIRMSRRYSVQSRSRLLLSFLHGQVLRFAFAYVSLVNDTFNHAIK